MISIVVWLWNGPRHFLPQHVTTLAKSIKRTLSVPHRFICVTDFTQGFGPEVEVVPMPPAAEALGRLRTPEAKHFPSCYARLWTFSEEAKVLGERLFLTDIDLVVIKDLAPLFNRTEDFVGWRPKATWGKSDRIGGGMYLLTAGAHRAVYDDFRGAPSIAVAKRAGYRGSDQAWISYCLGRSAAVWPKSAGLYSIRDLRNGLDPLPVDAVAVQFNGPSSSKPHNSPLKWVREHWR